MAFVKVQQVGDYGVLRRRDTFYVTHHCRRKKRRIYRSLYTKDLATALTAVQCLDEILAELNATR